MITLKVKLISRNRIYDLDWIVEQLTSEESQDEGDDDVQED